VWTFGLLREAATLDIASLDTCQCLKPPFEPFTLGVGGIDKYSVPYYGIINDQYCDITKYLLNMSKLPTYLIYVSTKSNKCLIWIIGSI